VAGLRRCGSVGKHSVVDQATGLQIVTGPDVTRPDVVAWMGAVEQQLNGNSLHAVNGLPDFLLAFNYGKPPSQQEAGSIIWQTADPQGAADLGFVSTANGVVYAGSDAALGDTVYALDASNGAIDWGFPSGGAVISGAAIVNGSVYWGSGYYIPTGVSNDQLYAFSLPGGPTGAARHIVMRPR
jgi:hypothetical protein